MSIQVVGFRTKSNKRQAPNNSGKSISPNLRQSPKFSKFDLKQPCTEKPGHV